MSDLIRIEPITTIEHWLSKYKPVIRCTVEWRKLEDQWLKKPPKVVTEWMGNIDGSEAPSLAHPWYIGGDWTDGHHPIFVEPGDGPFVIRVPCFREKIKAETIALVLDGNHRLRSLRPRVIVADLVLLTKKQMRHVHDFHHDFWRS